MAQLPKLAVFDLGEGPNCGEFHRTLFFPNPSFSSLGPVSSRLNPPLFSSLRLHALAILGGHERRPPIP